MVNLVPRRATLRTLAAWHFSATQSPMWTRGEVAAVGDVDAGDSVGNFVHGVGGDGNVVAVVFGDEVDSLELEFVADGFPIVGLH